MDLFEDCEKAMNEAFPETVIYKRVIDVNIEMPGMPTFPDRIKAEVAYELDMDVRSWGIKDIDVFPRGTTEFSFSAPNGDDIDVQVDLEEAKVTYLSGGNIVPSQLKVVLDKAYNVVSSELEMYFLVKE